MFDKWFGIGLNLITTDVFFYLINTHMCTHTPTTTTIMELLAAHISQGGKNCPIST